LGQGTFDQMSTSGIDFSNLLKRDKEDDIGDDELFQIQESAINFHSDKNDIGHLAHYVRVSIFIYSGVEEVIYWNNK
jgi:hypothetical protein